MANNRYFESEYIEQEQATTQPEQKESAVKELLKQPTNEEDMELYGTSKPRRIIFRSKLITDES